MIARQRSRVLATEAAVHFGWSLRSLRTLQRRKADPQGSWRTLADCAAAAGIKVAYLSAIELGTARNISPGVLNALPSAYGVSDGTIAALWLRARVMSALEEHGLTPEQRENAYRALEMRLLEMDMDVRHPTLKAVESFIE